MTFHSSAVGLELRSGDIQFRAAFARPAFGLFQDFPGLAQSLYGVIAPYGATLNDIRLDGTNGSLGDVHLAVSLLRLSAVLRVRLDHVELQCFDVRSARRHDLAEVFLGTQTVLCEHSPAPVIATYGLAVGLHGILDGTPATALVRKFVSAKELDLGPQVGVGAVLYFGPADGRANASVTVDLSAVVPDGLFVRVNANWDASSTARAELRSVGEAFFDEVVSKLGLELR